VVHKHQVPWVLTLCEQGKRRCIPPKSFTFILNHYFMLSLIVYYVYRN
jgi:hypothetical protein